MSYTNFDRHANMDEKTRTEILSLIKEIDCSDDLSEDVQYRLVNQLYGLFDGYLYKGLIFFALDLPGDLSKRLIRIYDTCNAYPKI